jgi:phosphotransferase system  glucose/maltose/N-acetylglucosamine-specific IIC component
MKQLRDAQNLTVQAVLIAELFTSFLEGVSESVCFFSCSQFAAGLRDAHNLTVQAVLIAELFTSFLEGVSESVCFFFLSHSFQQACEMHRT